jgi:hypothetical protein
MNQQIANRSGTVLAPHLDYFLLDGSSSMTSKWHVWLQGIEDYRKVLLQANANSHGIVSVFSTSGLQDISRDGRLIDWPNMREFPISQPGGGTPLYDAINLMGRHLRDLKPQSANVIIVTDGEEFDSTHTTAAQAKAILDWMRAQGWPVTFIGADFNNYQQARLLGADASNTLAVRGEKASEMAETLARKRLAHMHGGDGIEFSDEEKEKFGGYLTAH